MEWGVETMHWLLDVRYREDYFRAQNENIQKNMNMSRKLALYLARVYKNKHSKKTPLSHIMFDCLMDPYHLLTVLGKNWVPWGWTRASAWKEILRDNSETRGFLTEPVQIFECFLGQRNSNIRTFLIRPGIQQWKKTTKEWNIVRKAWKKRVVNLPVMQYCQKMYFPCTFLTVDLCKRRERA